MKKRVLIVMILIVPLLFIGCSNDYNTKNDYSYKMSLTPKQVIENYFKYYSKKMSQNFFQY
ncbi:MULTISPECIES: hypothetical protein [unclassified Clostridium]|uniref:hypothetical protein n=1 Tax=unclassified Clostridium TaxID=2614128 RepID=UPI003F9203F0